MPNPAKGRKMTTSLQPLIEKAADGPLSVSYTHLTLPTKA